MDEIIDIEEGMAVYSIQNTHVVQKRIIVLHKLKWEMELYWMGNLLGKIQLPVCTSPWMSCHQLCANHDHGKKLHTGPWMSPILRTIYLGKMITCWPSEKSSWCHLAHNGVCSLERSGGWLFPSTAPCQFWGQGAKLWRTLLAQGKG